MQRKFIGIKELSEYLSVSKHALYFWVAMRKIPFLKIGKIIRFDLQELEIWFEKHKIKNLDY